MFTTLALSSFLQEQGHYAVYSNDFDDFCSAVKITDKKLDNEEGDQYSWLKDHP